MPPESIVEMEPEVGVETPTPKEPVDKAVMDDIKDMISDEPQVEPPAEKGEKEEVKDGEQEPPAEGVAPKEEDEKEEKEGTVAGGETPAGEGELDPLLVKLGELSKMAALYEQSLQKEPPKADKPPVAPPEPPAEPPKRPIAGAPTDYVTKEMFEGTFDEKERAVLNAVLNRVVGVAVGANREQSLRDAVEAVVPLARQEAQGLLAAQEFWAKNTDLKRLVEKYPDMASFVSLKATQVQKTNPTWNIGQVYKGTEKEVRELLGNRLDAFKAEAAGTDQGGTRRPALPQRPGGARHGRPGVVSGLTDEQKQIKELMDYQD